MKYGLYTKFVLLTVLFLTHMDAHAKRKHTATGERLIYTPKAGLDFIENKGQWKDPSRFKATIPGGALFLTDNGFVYNFIERQKKADSSNPVQRTRSHAYRVSFQGGNSKAAFKKERRRSYYHNYFLGSDTARWQGKVGLYGKIVREQIYKGIDMVIYGKGNHMKYDFLLQAGADPTQIKLLYEYAEPEITKEGNLRIPTSVNEVIEQAPYSYQIINGKEKRIPTVYKLDRGILTFVFPEGYDTSLPLVIDPELIYATYSGASYPDTTDIFYYNPVYGHASTYDNEGRLYAGCSMQGTGWPVSFGAVQTAAAENRDVTINVYNTEGTALIYATYYGGEIREVPYTMAINNQGDLVMAGITCSETDFPLTPGCFDSVFNGAPSLWGGDMFVAHFSSDGSTLIGSTYLGGTGYEASVEHVQQTGVYTLWVTDYANALKCPMELVLDDDDNIWLLANTNSTDFPTTTNALQPVFGGGLTDAVLCKFNPDCSQLLYSSFLGGSGSDLGYGLLFNHAGNLVLCGGTYSSDFPTTPTSLHPAALGGPNDGFVTIVNPANGAILQSTYLGTDTSDQATMIQVDEGDNVFTAVSTLGDYPVNQNVFSMENGNIILEKLSPDLGLSLTATKLGNTRAAIGSLQPMGMVYTDCNQLVFTGFAYYYLEDYTPPIYEQLQMPVTADAMDTTKRNYWFCALSNDFLQLNYASYFGAPLFQDRFYAEQRNTGNHRYNPDGTIYQTLSTYSMAFPTTPNAWSTSWGLPVNTTPDPSWFDIPDAVSFKINLYPSLRADFELDATVNGNDSGCAPYIIQTVNTSHNGHAFTWDFGDGSPTAISNLADPPPHTYTQEGTYTITLIAENDTACIKRDTAYMTINVFSVTQPIISLSDTLLCQYPTTMDISVYIANPNPGFDISWGPLAGILGNPNTQTITVDPLVSNSYYVTVTDDVYGICSASASDTTNIMIAAPMLTLVTGDTTVCEGEDVQIVAEGNPLYTYHWTPATGISDTTALQPLITVVQPEMYTLIASYPGCPDTALTLDINMHFYPEVSLGPDKAQCQWTDVALESVTNPYRNDYLYTWSPATPNLSDPTGPNTYFNADTSITYILTVQTPIGCSSADTINIIVYPGAFGVISADTGYCPGNQAQLIASGGLRYSWTPAYGLNDTAVANPLASPQTSTDYTVIIVNEQGCIDTEKVSVQVYPNAILEMPDSMVLYPGEKYQLQPGTNCLYFSWFPPSGISSVQVSDPVFDPEVRTRYFVTATTEQGCTLRDSIDILRKGTVIDMPNAFMPSGNNPVFKPALRGIATLKQFNIFNRWGNKVYSSSNINGGWDGTYNGQPQPIGVYVYSIEAVTDSGQLFVQKGNVTLIR